MIVKLGDHNNSTKVDYQDISTDEQVCNDEPQEILINSILPHPNCKPEPDWKNDIALLRMEKAPTYTSKMSEIFLVFIELYYITLLQPFIHIEFFINSTLLRSQILYSQSVYRLTMVQMKLMDNESLQ